MFVVLSALVSQAAILYPFLLSLPLAQITSYQIFHSLDESLTSRNEEICRRWLCNVVSLISMYHDKQQENDVIAGPVVFSALISSGKSKAE